MPPVGVNAVGDVEEGTSLARVPPISPELPQGELVIQRALLPGLGADGGVVLRGHKVALQPR